MKKVAFISDGWKRFFIYAWVDGIINRIRDYCEEVCLHHYNCHGNWSSDELHNQGEYNIFNLPDLEQYDGIILDCNNITDKNQLNYIIEHVRKSKVPTVSIARDIEGFYYAGIDNAQPINNLMEHMYNVHNCRSFVFAGGPIDNYENDCRIAAYKDFLEEKSLDVEDNPVFYGDYDFKNGVEFFKKYVEEGRKIPDVVICACDNIAAGVCAQAEEMGYRVPDDFKVTGFDNLDKAAYFRPQITTVDHHNRGKTSRMCMNILIDIWEGRNPKKYNFSETTCIFGESCGCANSGLVDYREHIRGQIIYGIHKDLEDERINELEGNMAKCGKFVELYECMNRFLIELGCDGFFVVADEALVTGKNKNHFPTKGYHKDSLNVVYAYDNGKKHKFESIEELNVYLEESGVKNDYLFTPIHFRQYAVGYSIIKNAKFLYDNPYLYDLHNILVKNIEAMYTQMKVELANKKLKEIYNRDQLTGIYNRVAYAEIITPMFKRCYEENIVCAIGFVDVDKFKQINDTYGHDYGDEVLKKVANILQKKCPKYGYVCRYGGDEFIVFFPHANKESAERVKHSISEAAQDIGVKLSIGMILSSEDHGSNIDDYFEIADKCMYEEKMRHKNEE